MFLERLVDITPSAVPSAGVFIKGLRRFIGPEDADEYVGGAASILPYQVNLTTVVYHFLGLNAQPPICHSQRCTDRVDCDLLCFWLCDAR
eukprot:3573551-Ditylum_brightwellii.AAC.1